MSWLLGARHHVDSETGKVGECGVVAGCRNGEPGRHFDTAANASRWASRETARGRLVDRPHPANGHSFTVDQARPFPDGKVVLEDVDPATWVGKRADDTSYVVDPAKVSAAVTLPAGRWFIGDPYLVLGRHEQLWNAWVETVETSGGFDTFDAGCDAAGGAAAGYRAGRAGAGGLVGAYLGKFPVVAFRTWTGAGTFYLVAPPRVVPCESGLIGALPFELLEWVGLTSEEVNADRLGLCCEVKKPLSMWQDGVRVLTRSLMLVPQIAVPNEGETMLRAAESGAGYEMVGRRWATYDSICEHFIEKLTKLNTLNEAG
jgi:hypothetical protein